MGHKWWLYESICWFRKVIEIPPKIVGANVTGQRVRLKLGMDNEAEVFVDGRRVGRLAWWEGDIPIPTDTPTMTPTATETRPIDQIVVSQGYGGSTVTKIVDATTFATITGFAGLRELLRCCWEALRSGRRTRRLAILMVTV